ncbi:hypothetical protein IFM89_039113, partial [Coptis chinensis]
MALLLSCIDKFILTFVLKIAVLAQFTREITSRYARNAR